MYENLFNKAIVNEVNKLMPIEQKVKNAFDKIVNENLKIYEPKGGSKGDAGVLKQMISDIVSQTGKGASNRNIATPLFIQKVFLNRSLLIQPPLLFIILLFKLF